MGLIAATQSALFQHHIDMLFYHLFMTSSSRVYLFYKTFFLGRNSYNFPHFWSQFDLYFYSLIYWTQVYAFPGR